MKDASGTEDQRETRCDQSIQRTGLYSIDEKLDKQHTETTLFTIRSKWGVGDRLGTVIADLIDLDRCFDGAVLRE